MKEVYAVQIEDSLQWGHGESTSWIEAIFEAKEVALKYKDQLEKNYKKHNTEGIEVSILTYELQSSFEYDEE